ncbi:MAG: LysM peptidoglycan-binding domain-containing protein [Burkholderiales bacterium]|nr:LysM peptidoglycan-binding domain-containing protein [Burkholderiales bacterium]
MRLKFRFSIIPLVLLSGWFSLALADELQLADNAPSRYTVVKGDTLWDISGRFLKKPWRWPEIWNMNRQQIKDPHWIYPGDVIVMTMVDGRPQLSIARGDHGERGTVKLSPHIRQSSLNQAIPSIPSTVIDPFLTRPLVIDEAGLAKAPAIVGTESERVIIGAGNKAYVAGLDTTQGDLWQIYRPGAALKDPDNGEILGYEATYLGDARLTRAGNPATVAIVRSTQEINQGDRLVIAGDASYPSYSPRAPEKDIKGRIMSSPQGVAEIGQNAIVTINRGARDGLEVGHVLAISRLGSTVKEPGSGGLFNTGRGTIKLPDERNGLLFIFRAFEKVSYGLVMQSLSPIHVGDVVQTPGQ